MQYTILLIVALFIGFQIIKFSTFLMIAIGRTREKKGLEKINSKNLLEAVYQQKNLQKQKWILAQNTEEVTIYGFHDTKLTGHFFRAQNEKRVVVAFHGWRSNWKKDFALCVEEFLKQDCSVLLVEQRAHGRSGGKHIGFGILERYDCKRWTEYLLNRFGKEMPVYLYGVSMGASTVLMASGLNLPENVKGIIADCGFTTPYQMMIRFAKKVLKVGEYPNVPVVNKLCHLAAGYDFKEYSTLDAMEVCKLPVLFIHGTEDHFVPYNMTLQNFQKCKSRKELFLVEGAEHCKCFYVASEQYMLKIQRFFGWNNYACA